MASTSVLLKMNQQAKGQKANGLSSKLSGEAKPTFLSCGSNRSDDILLQYMTRTTSYSLVSSFNTSSSKPKSKWFQIADFSVYRSSESFQ